ncbi:hypothetical protein BXZ70DRAFT_1049645, partial [Cristinia sonorae]
PPFTLRLGARDKWEPILQVDAQNITCLVPSPDSMHVVFGTSEGDLRIWDLTTGAITTSLIVDDNSLSAVAGVVFLQDKRLRAITVDGIVRTWAAAGEKPGFYEEVETVALEGLSHFKHPEFSLDGCLVAAFVGVNVQLWQLDLADEQGRILGSFPPETMQLDANYRLAPDCFLMFSLDSTQLFARFTRYGHKEKSPADYAYVYAIHPGPSGRSVSITHLSGKEYAYFKFHGRYGDQLAATGSVETMDESSDRPLTSFEPVIVLFSIDGHRDAQLPFRSNAGWPLFVSFSPSDSSFATLHDGGYILLWRESHDGGGIHSSTTSIVHGDASGPHLCFTPDGRRIIFEGKGGLSTRVLESRISNHNPASYLVSNVLTSPDFTRLAIIYRKGKIGPDRKVEIWDIRNGSLLSELKLDSMIVLLWEPDSGSLLVSDHSDILAISATTGRAAKPSRYILGSDDYGSHIKAIFSPDGAYLLTITRRWLYIHDQTGSPDPLIEGSITVLTTEVIAWSTQNLIAYGDEENIFIWTFHPPTSPSAPRGLTRLKGATLLHSAPHCQSIDNSHDKYRNSSLVFSPNGSSLYIYTDPPRLFVYDVQTRACQTIALFPDRVERHRFPARHLAVSSDETTIWTDRFIYSISESAIDGNGDAIMDSEVGVGSLIPAGPVALNQGSLGPTYFLDDIGQWIMDHKRRRVFRLPHMTGHVFFEVRGSSVIVVDETGQVYGFEVRHIA